MKTISPREGIKQNKVIIQDLNSAKHLYLKIKWRKSRLRRSENRVSEGESRV
jgi:hypothetical protein